jgi:hypothetical protein
MKKIVIVALAVVLLAVLLPAAAYAAPKGIDLNGTHYNLNLIGKDKVMPGDYSNPDRHTMFVPVDTSGYSIPLNTPNNLGETSLPGIKINMTQGSEFAVLDGNATDGVGSFQLGAGKYAVYIAVKAKSPKYADAVTNITGWVEAFDDLGDLWYYIKIGTVSVSKSKTWTNSADLFYVTDLEDTFGFIPDGADPVWVFDYMNGLDNWYETSGGTAPYDLDSLAYFWQLDNQGNKLIQVRFYPQ